MPFVSQREGYIISPYMDWLSFFFNNRWRKPMSGMVSLMIKMADDETGTVDSKVRKVLTIMALAKRISKIIIANNQNQ